jgi:hypothetical protein
MLHITILWAKDRGRTVGIAIAILLSWCGAVASDCASEGANRRNNPTHSYGGVLWGWLEVSFSISSYGTIMHLSLRKDGQRNVESKKSTTTSISINVDTYSVASLLIPGLTLATTTLLIVHRLIG